MAKKDTLVALKARIAARAVTAADVTKAKGILEFSGAYDAATRILAIAVITAVDSTFVV